MDSFFKTDCDPSIREKITILTKLCEQNYPLWNEEYTNNYQFMVV